MTSIINKFSSNENKDLQELEQNRQLLLKVITNIVKYCDIYYDTFKSNSSQTLIDLLIRIEPNLAESLKSPPFSTYTFVQLESELFDSIALVYKEIIRDEIRQSKYVSCITEECTEIVSQCQVSLIFRYVTKNEIVERFYTTFEMPDLDAKSISNVIIQELEQVFPTPQCKARLISQSHITSTILSPLVTHISNQILHVFPEAHYAHYYSQDFLLTLEKSLFHIKPIQHFFANLRHIYSMFLKPDFLYDTFVGYAQHVSEGSFHKGPLFFIAQNKEELKSFFGKLLEDPFSTALQITESKSNISLLENEEFLDLLDFIHRLFRDLNDFYSKALVHLDEAKTKSALNITLMVIESNYKDVLRREAARCDNKKDPKYLRSFTKIEVCTTLGLEMKLRFDFKELLQLHTLFKLEKVYTYNGNFPLRVMESVASRFNIKDFDHLKNELTMLYSRPEFLTCKNALEFLFVLNNLQLRQCFENTMNLLTIANTIPTMFIEKEQTISCQIKVKKCIENILCKHSLSANSLILFLESKFIKERKRFPEKVLDAFCKLNSNNANNFQ